MSIVSSTHDVVPFDSKSSKALDGQRLAKILYKTIKGKNGAADVKPENMCVSIPVLSSIDDSEMLALRPYVLAMLHDTQDAIIKSLYEDGSSDVQDAQINVQSCIAWLEEESKGARLTRAMVIEWFADSLADALTVAISDKLGLSDTPSDGDTKRVEQMVAVYRDAFAGLAGGKTAYKEDKCAKLLKVLELANDDDAMAIRFVARLNKMMEPETVDMLGL